MPRILIALAMLIGMGSSASAERIAVSCDRSESAEIARRVIDSWVTAEGVEGDRQVIDVGVLRVTEEPPANGEIAVVAELRVSVSERGRIVSVLSGSSRVSVPAQTYVKTGATRLRREALVAAAQAMLPRLRAHLRPVTRVARAR